MLEATIDSINTPYVQMNEEIGPGQTMMAAVAAGIPADTPGLTPEINNVLGSASPTPLEEATAFATFANRGERPDTTMITEIRNTSGDVLYEFDPESTEAFSQKVSDRVTYALRQVVTSGTGVAAQAAERPVAGKTGTSDNYVSAWFSGYTPQLSAAVMAVREDEQGNEISLLADGGLTEGTGGALPAQIFGAYIDQAMADMPVEYFEEPESVYDRTASPTTAPPSQQSFSPEPTTSPEPTNTPQPTFTPEPTNTPQPTLPPTPTPTLPPTPTPEPTLTPPPTLTPEPTYTPEPSYSQAPVTSVPQGSAPATYSDTSPAAAVSPASAASGSTAAGAVAVATLSGAGLLRRRRPKRR
jgi:membrane peptidoglycan carboxypeptidase